MALAPVTGRLTDFGRVKIPASAEPRLSFRPRWPGIADGILMTGEPVEVGLSDTTSFSAMLEECDLVEPAGFHYIAEVTYFRAGKAIRTDSFSRTPIYVPPGGGSLRDIIKAKPQPGQIVWAPGKPTRGGVVWFDNSDVTAQGVMVYAPRKA